MTEVELLFLAKHPSWPSSSLPLFFPTLPMLATCMLLAPTCMLTYCTYFLNFIILDMDALLQSSHTHACLHTQSSHAHACISENKRTCKHAKTFYYQTVLLCLSHVTFLVLHTSCISRIPHKVTHRHKDMQTSLQTCCTRGFLANLKKKRKMITFTSLQTYLHRHRRNSYKMP